MNALDAVTLKVRKLLRLAENNPNPNEAANAAAQAQRLIDEHQLSQAMLEIDSQQPVNGLDDEPVRDFTYDAPLDAPKKMDRWRVTLAGSLARANACRILIYGSRAIGLVGRPSDADAVRHLYAFLTRELEQLTTEHGRRMGRTWRNNFRLGVVDTIQRKLADEREAFRHEARESAAGSSVALLRIDNALARVAARGTEVDNWITENMQLGKGRAYSPSRYDANARLQGRRAGERISINRSRGGIGSTRSLGDGS